MTLDRDLGQSSFQTFVELERLRSDRNSGRGPARRSHTLAVEKSTNQNWLFEGTQGRTEPARSLNKTNAALNNNRLAQYFEITPEPTTEDKLSLLKDELHRLDELSVDQLRTLRREIAKLLHPDTLQNFATEDATSKLAEINAALDAAISRALPHPK